MRTGFRNQSSPRPRVPGGRRGKTNASTPRTVIAHPVFRIQRNSAPAFDRSGDGDRDDATVVVEPGEDAIRDLRRKHPGREFGPLRVRLVRYEAGGSEYCLATALADADRYGVADLSDLYHGRWSIEELCKISKTFIGVDEYHARSERGVRQETYVHFALIAATRSLEKEGDDLLAQMRKKGKPRRTVNFKSALALAAANLEELLLAGAAFAAEAGCARAARTPAYRKIRRANGRGGAQKNQNPNGRRGAVRLTTGPPENRRTRRRSTAPTRRIPTIPPL